MALAKLTSIDEVKSEEGEFYRLALSPHLEDLDFSSSESIDDFFKNEVLYNSHLKRRLSPWRKNYYDPFSLLDKETLE